MKYVLDFAGRIVVVTGGSSGIGKAAATAFSECGANVIVLDIKMNIRPGKGILYKKADVSVEKEVQKAIKEALKELGAENIDILINNAGIEFNEDGNLIDMPMKKLRRIMDVNLYGYINCARAIVPYMKKGSRIVNVSSIQAIAAHLPGTSYQITKSGIMGLTNSLAIELASKGINVNAVAPGAIATEGMGAIRSGDPGIVDRYRKRIPLGRRGHPEEVALPMLFLCSELASYITGETLVIDGGYTKSITPVHDGPAKIVENDPDAE